MSNREYDNFVKEKRGLAKGKRYFQLVMPYTIYERMKYLAAAEHKTMARLVLDALLEYFELRNVGFVGDLKKKLAEENAL